MKMILKLCRTKIDLSYGSFRILRTECKGVPYGTQYALVQIAKGQKSMYRKRYGTMSKQWAFVYAFGMSFWIRYKNFYG